MFLVYHSKQKNIYIVYLKKLLKIEPSEPLIRAA